MIPTFCTSPASQSNVAYRAVAVAHSCAFEGEGENIKRAFFGISDLFSIVYSRMIASISTGAGIKWHSDEDKNLFARSVMKSDQ